MIINIRQSFIRALIYGIRLFFVEGIMLNIRFNGNLDYIIDSVGYVNVMRNSNFTVPYKTGKPRYTIIFVESGEMKYFFEKTREYIILTKGSILFVPKNTPYEATYTKDNTVAKVFIFDIIQNTLSTYFNTPSYYNNPVFFDICTGISEKHANNAVFLVSKIYEILYTMEQENSTIPGKYKKILPAVNEIQERYFENKKLSYYSDLCYMSESNFRKLFREYTGKTLIEYRNLIRISQAYKKICSGEYTIQEAAYLSGFNNMSFFYELYRRHIKE